MKRRDFLFLGTGLAAVAAAGYGGMNWMPQPAATNATSSSREAFEITRTEAEWRAILTDTQYKVLREEATERAFTSPLNTEKREGTYHCAGCDLPLYASNAKYDSGTGWPSFYQSLPDAIATKDDYSLLFKRTEVHCRRCGGHLGHIFDDGPEPTGKRHCLNGVALKFVPA